MGIILLKVLVSVVVAAGLWGFVGDIMAFLFPQEDWVSRGKGK